MNQQEKQSNIKGSESLRELRRRWKDGTFREILEDWKWIFTYSRRYKGAIAFYTLLGILSTTLGLVGAVASKHVIDIITGYQTSKLAVLIVIYVGSTLFSLVLSSLLGRISLKLGIRIGNDVQRDIFDKIIDADWAALNRYESGDILNRFSNDIGTVGTNAVSWLPTIIVSLYRFAATFFVILHYDWIMAVFAFATAPALLLASRFILRRQREHGKKVRKMASEVMSFELETFYNMDTIKSFGITDQYSARLRDWQEKFKKVNLDYNLFTIQTNVFLTVLGSLVSMGAFGYCLYQLWTHAITYGTMTLFLQQTSKLSGAFQNVIGIIPSFLNSSISAHRIRELVELPKEHHVEASRSLRQKAEGGFTVELRDLDFAYVEDRTVIRDSRLIASPGEIVALIGASGEGKTTLIRLILALVRPGKGQALIRAADGTEYELNAETRRLFSYVPQGNTILSGTIAENLRMGKADADEAEMVRALETACAWEFVRKLPEGIHTKLGRRGKGLSEGQAQRIAIARAVLRNAPVLLLDEATSALDVATERRVLKNVMESNPRRTCIVTTHRPTVLSLCRRVYRVVDQTVTELDEESSARMAMEF
ncbi:MAG: ABC transporter ATP-binding protein [Oscillospiraceae bacterium]|nr:ABC transporter ATP-binding protein [Oscillospiraceae bacterium]